MNDWADMLSRLSRFCTVGIKWPITSCLFLTYGIMARRLQ